MTDNPPLDDEATRNRDYLIRLAYGDGWVTGFLSGFAVAVAAFLIFRFYG